MSGMCVIVPVFLTGWIGLTLVLSELVWFRRRRLAERLAPYTPGGTRSSRSGGLLSVASFREVIAPLAQTVGERLASIFGVGEDLDRRLTRIHSTETASELRVRQVGWTVCGAVVATALAVAVGASPTVSLFLIVGAPLLSFLLVEQQIATASARWQERLEAELPVVAEQMAMLLGAGYSLSAAIVRLAERGNGACSQDFVRIHQRIRQGIATEDALREWAVIADVAAVHRLAGVLAFDRAAGDLGRLISDEARAIRRESQRRMIERIERRNQQVWIPVTVATLLPGVVLLAVPFIDALSAFSGS